MMMRRSLVLALAFLTLAVGGYGVYWWIAADQAETAVERWIQDWRRGGYTVEVADRSLGGFPGVVALELRQVGGYSVDFTGLFEGVSPLENTLASGELGFECGGGFSQGRDADEGGAYFGENMEFHGRCACLGQGQLALGEVLLRFALSPQGQLPGEPGRKDQVACAG